MKNALLLLSFLALCTACNKSDSHSDPGQLDSLIKVTMANGDVIYVHPTDNSIRIQWGPPGTNITALPDIMTKLVANMDFNGETNTTAIVTQMGTNNGTTYAAKLCADLVAYGYDDWYLPAAGEFNEMYKKLGPVADGGSGQIETGFYWSSSEVDGDNAWAQSRGVLSFSPKADGNLKCRCVRR